MARYTHRVWIDRRPDEVFGVLMDASLNRRWQTGVVSTHAATNDVTVGTRLQEVREFAGYRTTIVYELTELVWGTSATVRLVDGPLRGAATYECRSVDGGTEVTVSSDVAPQGRWRCVARAVGGVLSAELAVSCQRLKMLLEEPALDVTLAQPSYA